MARSNNYIPNFTGGEISPRSASRRDLEGYYNSCEFQSNFISDLQGGARFRPGSRINVESTGFRLIPFVYDALDNYFVEIGKWVRILNPDGSPKVRPLVSINQWVVERVEKRTDELVFHVSAASYTHLVTSGLFSLTLISPELDDDFKRYAGGYLDDDRIAAINTSTINGAWREVVVDSPGTVAAAAVTPTFGMIFYRHEAFLADYSSEEAQRLQFAQKRDEMWMTCGSKPAKKLTRTIASSEITFTFADAVIDEDGAGNQLDELSGSSSGTDVDQYPYCVALFENRLWYAHTNDAPDVIWGSQVGLFERFDPAGVSPTDADSVRFQSAFESDDIIFMLPDKDLLYLGTLGGGLGFSGGSGGTPITQSTYQIRRLHTVGTSFGRPYFQYESDLYFVDRGGTGLWRVQYNYNTEKYEPELITLASDNLTKAGIRSAAVKNGDDARIYLSLTGGGALANTISRIYGAKAFARLDPGLNEDLEAQYAFGNFCALPTSRSQDIVGGIVSDASGAGVIFVFANENTSTNVLKDEMRQKYGANEIEAKEAYDGYAYFKAQTSEYLDLSSTGGDVRFGTITFSAATGTGVTVTCPASIFVVGDVGKRILVNTTPSLANTNVGAGIALITAYTSATSVTVTIEQDLNGLVIPTGFWYMSVPSGSTINLPSYIYRGKKIDVLIDGVVYPNITIGDDNILTLPAEGFIYQFGFKYQGILKTVNMQGIGQLGTSEGLPKNLHKLRVNFFETGQGTSYGTDYYRLENLNFAQLDDPTDRPPPLFSGEKTIRFDENWEKEKHIYIRHEGGTPCTVLSLIPFFNTSMD